MLVSTGREESALEDVLDGLVAFNAGEAEVEARKGAEGAAAFESVFRGRGRSK